LTCCSLSGLLVGRSLNTTVGNVETDQWHLFRKCSG